MTVRRISKRGLSRSVDVAGAGTVTLGKAIEVETSGHVRVALDSGEQVLARVPMHVDLRWLTAALARAPVEVAVAFTTSRAALLWCVFPSPEHASVRREIAAPDIVIRADRSLELRCEILSRRLGCPPHPGWLGASQLTHAGGASGLVERRREAPR